MMNFKKALRIGAAVIVMVLISAVGMQAQEEVGDFFFEVNYDTPLTIDLEEETVDLDSIRDAKEKKKQKKKVFYGIKTKKGFTKTGFGENIVIEQFYYLKEQEAIDPYVRDVYWYNFKKKKIVNSRRVDWDNGALLHGPYKKLLGEQVLEEGIFYKGLKHGRWVRLNRHDILQAKEKFYKGWPKHSQVAYWNKETRQIKEVIPIQYGEKEGYYYAFHENGNIAAVGEYHFDHKIGLWREYYPERGKKKREVQYSDYAFDDTYKPVILKEWNERGIVIYDREKYLRSISQ